MATDLAKKQRKRPTKKKKKARVGDQHVDFEPRIQGITSSLDDVKLRGRSWRAEVGDNLLGASLERTIEGASTLTLPIHDPSKTLLESDLLAERFTVEVDDLLFDYVGISKQGADALSLTFEDHEISRLRKKKGAKKAWRDRVTRAEFARALVREAGAPPIPFYSPELHVTQPIGTAKKARAEKPGKSARREPGLSPNANFTIKGVRADRTQINNTERVLDVGLSRKCPQKVLIAAICTIFAESLARNLGGGDRDSVGLFQQRPSQGWPASQDVERDATGFFKVAMQEYRQNPSQSAPALAQAVQRSGVPSAFAARLNEATRAVELYLNGATATAASGGTEGGGARERYAFERKKKENSWRCLRRLAEEVGWRCFVSAGIVYFVSETTLLASKLRATVHDNAPGVTEPLSFNQDSGQPITEVTLKAHGRAWAAPPGTVVEVIENGPANGLYIVSSVRSDLGRATAPIDVTLKRPTPPLPEPLGEQKRERERVRRTDRGSGGSSASALEDVKIRRTGSGSPGWGGTADIFMQFVHPFMRRHGLSAGGQKEGGHASGGDHDPGVGNAYACDYPTFNGLGIAREFANKTGASSWSPNSYATYTIRVDGRRFRVQLLWGGGIEHGDHIHVGIRAA